MLPENAQIPGATYYEKANLANKYAIKRSSKSDSLICFKSCIAYVVDIAMVESTTFFMVKKCADVLNFFRKPVFSSKIGIFKYKNLCSDFKIINAHVESITKCMVLPHKQHFIVLTMFH